MGICEGVKLYGGPVVSVSPSSVVFLVLVRFFVFRCCACACLLAHMLVKQRPAHASGCVLSDDDGVWYYSLYAAAAAAAPVPLLLAPRIFFSPSLLRFLPSLPLFFLSPRRTNKR